MPRYELMYLLSDSIADDQQPEISASVRQIVESFGASNLEEEGLGKKKLAYPINKTKNGYYVVLVFDLLPAKLVVLDAKLRTIKTTVVRFLIIKLDDYLKKLSKDKAAQAKRPVRETNEQNKEQSVPLAAVTTNDGIENPTVTKTIVEAEETKPVSQNLDEQIEAALQDTF